MTKARRILFFGELPPKNIQGIAYSNYVNLKMLGSTFIIDTVEEDNGLISHEKMSAAKIFRLIMKISEVAVRSIRRKYTYLYLTYSLSVFGAIKTLSIIAVHCLFSRSKVILHIHRGDFFSRFYASRFNRFITKIVFALTSKIIVLSNNQKLKFEQCFHTKFWVLSNTAEIELEPIIYNRTRKDFIYISNYLLDKGILDLLEVFSKLVLQIKNITLTTYGEFSDAKLKEKILSFQSEKIFIKGPITGIDKFSLIAKSDCLILPSWNEGQPVVILEAMSVGTPVIASDTGLVSEIFGADYPYLTQPGSRKSLEDKIFMYLREKDSSDISKKLKDIYDKNFSHMKHKADLSEIFN
jgi:glycosyltransferase involved in cell wall biosynthesis